MRTLGGRPGNSRLSSHPEKLRDGVCRRETEAVEEASGTAVPGLPRREDTWRDSGDRGTSLHSLQLLQGRRERYEQLRPQSRWLT